MLTTNQRLLVIDDNQEIHKDIRKILLPKDADSSASDLDALTADILGESEITMPEQPFYIDAVLKGEDGLRLVKQSVQNNKPYAMVFVDVRMPPGWDGIETVKHLWQVDKDLQVVLITAYSDYDWSDIIASLGYTGNLLILKKPFESIEIRQMATALCAKWNLAREAGNNTLALQQEIRQRKQANKQFQLINEQLLHSEKYRRLILDSSGDGIFGLDLEGNHTFVNSAAASMLGYKVDELLKQHSHSIWHYQYPDGSPYPENDCPIYKVLHDGKIRSQECNFICRDGSFFPVEFISTPIIEHQQVIGAVVSFRNISERKKAEQELLGLRHYLQNVIDSMPSLLLGVNKEACVTHCNKQAELFSGMSIQQAMGQAIDRVIPLLSPQITVIKKAIGEYQQIELEKQAYQQEGENYYFNIMIYPLESNSISGAVIRIDDVTQRVQMEQMIVQNEKMMSVGGLAAGMAHEINNPLGGILQGLQNIHRRLSPTMRKNQDLAMELHIDLENVQRYLQQRQILKFMDEMVSACERAAKIVDNMLQFSRHADTHFVKEDLNTLIDTTINLANIDYDLKKQYDFRSIKIKRELEPGLPAVSCVASEIQQVLLNLLRNAAQALQQKKDSNEPACISIRSYKYANGVRIEVEDNGPGIEKASLKRLFEPFFTTKAPGQGTGLGLSVSFFIIHNEHGGQMSVESQPGQGATFIIQLPAIAASKALLDNNKIS